MDYAGLTPRQRLLLRHGALVTERSSWINRYMEISEYLLPYSGRFFTQDRNRGDKSFNGIIDSAGTYALDTLSAGMMAGMTSPARPWFRLATSDKDLMEFAPVKLWLNTVTELMQDIFSRSNVYRALHSSYEELGAFATEAMIIEDNFDTVVHATTLTAGEYCIATDDQGKVNTLFREYEMTIEQIISKFVAQPNGQMDWSVVSPHVKNLWDTHRHYDAWVPVVHAIEPRSLSEREYGNPSAKNMPFRSCYIEKNASDLTMRNTFLRESGYKDFPATVSRWATRGGDVYGHGPSFRALGHIKQLQQEQLRKAQGIDYKTRPPVQVPSGMNERPETMLPGGVYVVDSTAPGQGIRTAFDVDINLEHLLVDIQDVRQAIGKAFYADLFRMLSNDNRVQPATAREIAEKHEEKLLMLGPVVERLHDEKLNPLIDLTFAKMVAAKILPPPPKEMQGQDLRVQFVSTLAQAQRMVGLGAVDRLLGTVIAVAQIKPEVADKLDADQLIDKYGDMTGVDPSLIVADDKVAVIRQQRAQAQAAAQRAAQIEQATKSAQNLGAIKTNEPNALTAMVDQLQGEKA